MKTRRRFPMRLTLIGVLLIMVLHPWGVRAQTYNPPNQFGGNFRITLDSNVDNNSTALGVVGSVVLVPIPSPNNVGPAYGSGLCGFAYRITGETNMDPSLVYRCNTYTFEGADLTWYGNLTSKGLCVGCRVGDSYAYPQARVDIRARGTGQNGQNAMRIVHLDDNTDIRCQVSSNSRDCCTIYDDPNGEPEAAEGRCGSKFGRPHNEINYGKWVPGTGWVYLGTRFSW